MFHHVIDLHTHYLRAQRLGQSSHLLIEQVFGLLPHPGGVAILQLEEAGQERLTELLGALTRHQRRQVVNTDNTEGRVLEASRESNGDGGLVEGGGDVVDGDRVVRVGAIGEQGLISIYSACVAGDTYVSALTSQTTDSLRSGVERDSTVTNLGMGADK